MKESDAKEMAKLRRTAEMWTNELANNAQSLRNGIVNSENYVELLVVMRRVNLGLDNFFASEMARAERHELFDIDLK